MVDIFSFVLLGTKGTIGESYPEREGREQKEGLP
jgi:hypothetical protein